MRADSGCHGLLDVSASSQWFVITRVFFRWDAINQEQEEQWRGEPAAPDRKKTLRDQLGLPDDPGLIFYHYFILSY